MQGNLVHKSIFTVFLVFVLALFAGNQSLAQDNIILAYGAVKDFNSNKKLEGVDITILQNGSPFETFITPGNGKYEFELPLGHTYVVEFSLDGYVGKKLQLDTKGIPEEDMAGGFQMSLDMSLFEYIEGFNRGILSAPIGKSSFDPQQNAMSWDEGYTARMQDKILDEFDRLENLEEEMAKLRKEFDELVAKGDQKMTEEKFSDAIGKYEDALKIFPDEEPAQKKLADAKAAYADANAAAELEANYQRLLAQGKNDIKKKNFENAQDALKEAIQLKPDEREPKDLLNQIAKDLEELEKRKQYEGLISDADSKFKNEDYAVSIETYNKALELFGNEQYPRDQIKEAQKRIDEKLAAEQANAELEAKYQEAMALGEKNLKAEEYSIALRNFEEARDLKSNEKLPKAKIAEIEGILADLAAQAERDNAASAADAEADRINKEYQALITAADEKFQAEKLEAAKKDYQAALALKSQEKYPKSRIDKIDDLLAEAVANANDAAAENEARIEAERINKEYQALITAADRKFEAEELEDAKKDYQAALALKELEKYPKSRIARIDDLIADANALADNSAAEEAARREAERLAAEEAERLERADKEKQKELDRERRLREEELERERLAAEKAAREEEAKRRSEEFANRANSSTEDDAERYYREARESEERAKKNAIEEKKENHENFLADENADSKIRRDEQAELLASKEDKLERIYRDGEMNREMKIDNSEKQKENYSRDLTEYTSDSDNRRADNNLDAISKGENYRSIDENDVYRQTKVDRSEREKESFKANSEEYDARGASLRQANEYDVKLSKEKERDQIGDGEQVRLENQKDSEFKKKTYSKYTGDLQAAADERLAALEDKTDEKKQVFKDISEGKEVYREENAYNVKKEKEDNAYLLSDKSEAARIQAYDKRKEAFDKQSAEPRDAEDYILPEGAEDLTEGVQERSYEEGNKMVIERIVKRGNIVNTYRKVISKTGIYYFKDGRSITESTWKRETLNVTD